MNAHRFRLVAAVFVFLLIGLASTGRAATLWVASTGGDTRYRSPEEACFLGVTMSYIDADRPSRPATAQYRILSSAVNAYGDGDYMCTGVAHVRTGPGATNWFLVLIQGDALVVGNGDSCNIPGYTDPVTGQCGPPKCTDECCGSCPNGSNPIHTASGNKHQVELDFVGAGAFPLRFERAYNSNRSVERNAAPIGAGWTHNYQRFVVGIGGNPFAKAVAYRPDGSVLAFSKVGANWQGDPDVRERLNLITDSTGMPIWTLTTPDDSVETYDGLGLLQSIRNRDGYTQTLSYVDASGRNSGRVWSVTDPEGRVLNFTYNASGQLTGITDGNAVAIAFGYTTANLTTAVYPDVAGTKTRTYLYNETGQTGGASQPYALTGIVDESSQRFASWGYTSAGRANVSVHGPFSGGTIDRTSLLFNSNGTTTVTDALGQSRVFGFAVQYLVARNAQLDVPCDWCSGAAKSRTYDANGYPATARDFLDTETRYVYDARGLETQRIEADTIPDPVNPAARITPPEKRTTNTTWNAGFRVPDRRTVVNAGGATESRTDWVYNARGQATARCGYDLTVSGASSYVCAATGTPPAGIRRWVTTYCDAVDGTNCPLVGLMRSVDGPRADISDVTTYTYRMADDTATPKKYRKGDLWKVTNALGQVAEYRERDGNGRVTRSVDANGVIVDMTYHPRGWLRTRTVKGVAGINGGADATTTIDYDAVGNVQRITQPDGVWLQYGYDTAHRLVSITDIGGDHIDYTLDAKGNRLAEKTFASGGSTPARLLTRSYNTLNRMTDQFDAQSRATTFAYDANGNRTDQTDPTGVKTHWQIDPLNRLKTTMQDYQGTVPATANTTTQFAYDARDNLRQVVDPDALPTAYVYDGLSDLSTLNSPDTGATTYQQDAAGNRTRQTDARGVVANYAYDALNRLKDTTYPVNASVAVGVRYDESNTTTGCMLSWPQGRVTRMFDSSGQTTWCHDHRGNVIRKTQVTAGSSYTVAYEYNLADRLTAIDYPSGARVEYVRDTRGRISAVKVRPTSTGTPANVASALGYQPFGPVSTLTFATGSQSLSFGHDQNYWITDVAGSVLNLHFCRDAVGNLSRLRTATPACTGTATEQYVYDALYRLTGVQDGAGATIEGYAYNRTGDRLSKMQGGTTQSYGYASPLTSHWLLDVGGNTRDYDAVGNQIYDLFNSQSRTYDERNRIVSYRRRTPGLGASMAYDYNGRGERVSKQGTVAGNSVSGHFVYDEGGQLLSDAGGGNTNPTDYVYADGRPIALVRGGAVYYVHSDHLGTPRAVTAAGSGTSIWSWGFAGNPFGEQGPGGSVEMRLRFPGQYYDQESGLYYNYFRDYEPGTSRYVESDPTGLAGDISTYAYAANNPGMYFDKNGKTVTCDAVSCTISCTRAIECAADYLTVYFEYLRRLKCQREARDCYEECKHLLPSPSGDLQSSEFRKCYRECSGSL